MLFATNSLTNGQFRDNSSKITLNFISGCAVLISFINLVPALVSQSFLTKPSSFFYWLNSNRKNTFLIRINYNRK